MNEATDDALTGRILRAAIEVHRELGPGFLESTDGEAMVIAMRDEGLRFQRQWRIPIRSAAMWSENIGWISVWRTLWSWS